MTSDPTAGTSAPLLPPRFRGEVELTHLHDLSDGSVRVSEVQFAHDGATYWHSHDGGQVLVVVSGRAHHQERGGPVCEAAAGDVVHVQPDVQHWHGAAGAAPMVHIAVSGGTTRWTDEAPPEAGVEP